MALVWFAFGSFAVATAGFPSLRKFTEGAAIVIQPDGRFVVAGVTSSCEGIGCGALFITRFTRSGQIDPSFGRRGTTVTPLNAPTGVTVESLVRDRSGRLVVGGIRVGSNDFVLARYAADGLPDRSFGSGGVVITDLGGNDYLRDLTDSPAGLVAAGETTAGGSAGDGAIALIRYREDGSLDSSFGGDGVVIRDFGNRFSADEARQVRVDSSGRYVTAGSTICAKFGAQDCETGFLLARFLPDGTPDTQLGGDGIGEVAFPLPSTSGSPLSLASSLLIEPDGTIVLGGGVGNDSASRANAQVTAVARYRPDGSLDPGFGNGTGEATGRCRGPVLLAPGRGTLTAVGQFTFCSDTFDAAGHLLRTRRRRLAPTRFGIETFASPSGGYLGTGSTYFTRAGSGRGESAVLVRFNSDGSLRRSFNHTGVATNPPVGRCYAQLGSIVGTPGDDVLAGTAGDDVIVAGTGNDRIHSLEGDDIVCAGPGNDHVFLGPGRDRAWGGSGLDRIAGGKGVDDIFGAP